MNETINTKMYDVNNNLSTLLFGYVCLSCSSSHAHLASNVKYHIAAKNFTLISKYLDCYVLLLNAQQNIDLLT